MAFNVLENTSPLILWKEVLNFFVVNVIQKFDLPFQSMNVTWESLRVIRGGRPLRHPLNLKGMVNQDIGTLDKGWRTPESFYETTFFYVFIWNACQLTRTWPKKSFIWSIRRTLFRSSGGHAYDTMVLKYRGGSNRIYGNQIISCTIRGELSCRKKSNPRKRKNLYLLPSNTIYE